MNEKGNKLWLVLLAILGIATLGAVIYTLSKPVTAIKPSQLMNVLLRFRPNRAVGIDPNTGKSDEIKAFYEILGTEYSGEITGWDAVTPAKVEVKLPLGTFTVKIYYPNKTYPKTTTTASITILHDNAVIDVFFDVAEPSNYTTLTFVRPNDAPDIGGMMIEHEGGKSMGIVNGTVASCILPIGSQIRYGGVWNGYEENIESNIRLTSELIIRTGLPIHTSENETTIQVILFEKHIPKYGYKIEIWRGDIGIVEGIAVDIGGGMMGLRKAIPYTSGLLTLLVKTTTDNVLVEKQFYLKSGSKVNTLLIDTVYKW